jgi:hypothetical protein
MLFRLVFNEQVSLLGLLSTNETWYLLQGRQTTSSWSGG